jgi:hypothetical protein
MRKILLSMALAGLMPFFCSGQAVTQLRPAEKANLGDYTEWASVDVAFKDGSTATIEYRLALVDRKGIACHFDVEVKNNSTQKLDIVVKSDYYDQLVKGEFSEAAKGSIKPDKSAVISTLIQGCKKDKSKDLSDYETCMACDFGLSIFVYN